MPTQPDLNIEDALQRAHAHWNAGQADQAEQYCQRVLAIWPGQADALHLMGLIAHAYGNTDIAIAHLRQACLAPRAPAVYASNLAEMCRQKGLLDEAETMARRAIAMDDALVMGWNNLGIILQECGKFEESVACLERVAAFQPDWAQAQNNLANTYRRLGRFDKAAQHYRRALALAPDYAEAHSNFAFLLSSQGRHDEAATEARLAIDLNPRLVDAYLNLAEVELSRYRYEDVLRVLDMLRAFAPQHPAALMAYAKALRHLERLEEALDFASKAVLYAPQNAEAHNTLATVLQSLGRTEDALIAFERAETLPGAVAEEAATGRAALLMEAGRKDEAMAALSHAIAHFPNSVQALSMLTDLQTCKPGQPVLAPLEACLAEGERRPLGDRVKAHFALAKAYMDLQEPAKAFTYLDEGNRLQRDLFDYSSAATKEKFGNVIKRFGQAKYKAFARSTIASELPVFVIGMPRSGTTLIEQILSSHAQVTGAGELSALRLVAERSMNFPDGIEVIDGAETTRMGQTYLNEITKLAQGSVRVVDKMPGNFIYAGLIPLILPKARIIHARRNAVDTCLSCYTKLFSGEQRFAYNQTELGEFYRLYEKLMAHWRAILPPERFLEIDYEAIVDDVEQQARRMIEFLGLSWDTACLEFQTNSRVVRTASVNQVRQPLYKSSKGRWKAYESWLGPLLDALGKGAA